MTRLEEAAETLLKYPDLAIAMVNALPDAVIAVDPNGRIRYANESAEWLTGYDRGALMEMESVESLLPDALREIHRSVHRPAFLRNPERRPMRNGAGPLELRQRTGDVVHVRIMLQPFASPFGLATMAVIRRAESEPE